MPKKFIGENSKAVVAKARKNAVKEAEISRKLKEVEDQSWKDDDKQIIKKQQKKEELERKKLNQLAKKAEAKAILQEEMNSIKKATKIVPPPPKITRAHIAAEAEKQNAPIVKDKIALVTHLEQPLEENINRVIIDGDQARNIDEAISILSLKDDDVDKHPEKRIKAAYTAFEEKRLKELKDENPSLRMSQLKQIVFKEWQKSPENPLNKI